MGRLVEPRPQTELTGADAAGSGYAERVAKYIPGEIVATYLSIVGILKTVKPEEAERVWVGWAVFGFCLVLTPCYFYMLSAKNKPRCLHMFISTAAFAVWAYALGGVFEMVGWYKSWLASIALACFTLASGLVAPHEGDK